MKLRDRLFYLLCRLPLAVAFPVTIAAAVLLLFALVARIAGTWLWAKLTGKSTKDWTWTLTHP